MEYFGNGTSNPHNWRDHIYGHGPAIYILALVVLGLIIFFAARAPIKTTVYTLSPRQSAWNACTAAVEKQLGLAPAEAEEFSPVAVTLLGENKYQADVHYPGKNVTRTCTVEQTPGGKWQVVSSQAK
jgi:hypothetical protein